MFEMREKFSSTRENVFKILRLIRDFEKADSKASLPCPVYTVAPYETAYSLADYFLEAKLKEAQALTYQRLFGNQRKAISTKTRVVFSLFPYTSTPQHQN
jgi:hypothetical protein